MEDVGIIINNENIQFIIFEFNKNNKAKYLVK